MLSLTQRCPGQCSALLSAVPDSAQLSAQSYFCDLFMFLKSQFGRPIITTFFIYPSVKSNLTFCFSCAVGTFNDICELILTQRCPHYCWVKEVIHQLKISRHCTLGENSSNQLFLKAQIVINYIPVPTSKYE